MADELSVELRGQGLAELNPPKEAAQSPCYRAIPSRMARNGTESNHALVIDSRAVLATEVCRRLSRLQWQVDIFGENGSPAFRSCFCHHCFVSPPWYSGEAFVNLLRRVVEEGNYDAILLCNERILELILPLVGSCPAWDALPLSRPESLKTVLSKNQTVRLAASFGVPVPRTVIPNNDREAESMGKELGFPHLVKGDKGEGAQNVRLVWGPDEILTQYRKIVRREAAYGGQPALQEFVPGPRYAVGGLFQNGEPLRVCAYRTLFTYPINRGFSAKAVTERPPKLLDHAFAIFEALQYTGLGQVQFIRDSRDGQLRFLEINPRVWGCIGLAQYAGVDLYTPYCALARGERVQADLRFREGVRYHRFSVELRLVTRRPLHFFQFICDSIDPRVHSDFQWSDPGPNLPTLRGLMRLFDRA